MLFLEGGYFLTRRGPRFWRTGPPTDEDIQVLVAIMAERVIRLLRKKGYFQDDVAWAAPESETNPETLFSDLQAASVQSRIALGQRKGGYVRRLGSLTRIALAPQLKGPLCAEVAGFSLHAAVYCAPRQRKKLEMLCRYIARPAVAEERLERLPSGDIQLRLKHPYSDGTTHLVFSGLEFVEKLAALVPQPRIHLTRFFGCLAPHSKIRSQIVPKKLTPAAVASGKEPLAPEPEQTRHSPWAELLARVFGFDLSKCPRCGGQIKIIAAILEPFAITSILSYLGLPDKPPPLVPSAIAHQIDFA
jgi:hypothetical protein